MILAAIVFSLLILPAPAVSADTNQYLTSVQPKYTLLGTDYLLSLDITISSQVGTLKVATNNGPEQELQLPDTDGVYHWAQYSVPLNTKITIKAYDLSATPKLIEAKFYKLEASGPIEYYDATLSEISVTNGSLTPVFDPNVENYIVELPSGTVQIPTVFAKASAGAGAIVNITQATDIKGTEAQRTATINVSVGDSQITKQYTVIFKTASLATSVSGQVNLRRKNFDNSGTIITVFPGNINKTEFSSKPIEDFSELIITHPTVNKLISIETDALGNFELSLEEGNYTIVVSKAKYLIKVENITVGPGNPMSLDEITLVAGDFNGDDSIDPLDLTILALSYNKKTGDPGFNSKADINEDGFVDPLDLTNLALNYNTKGDTRQ